MLGIALFGGCLHAGVHAETAGEPQTSPGIPDHPRHGPSGVYGRIPVKDELGRDQLAMFRTWNPDPVQNHIANLKALDPALAKVVWKAQADNPSLRFVIGSGRRDGRVQRQAVAWGWSKALESPHRSGRAVDLWPLDHEGRVHFDPRAQNKIADAMKRAATVSSVAIRWGGHFHGFKNRDRSHFQLVPP
jgi:peptidoglycan L-alanyl-D-glutamate endopeptidase CwlK